MRILFIFLFISSATFSQTSLSDYNFVVVPEQFEFLKSKDQYQMNSMAKFYFEKSGFNAYFTDNAPKANRCDGLYADVEELGAIFGTKLQVVLRDCYGEEIYRSEEGKSKYKEYDKTYQDALRKAFKSVERLHVNQKEVVLLEDTSVATKPVKEWLEDKGQNSVIVQSSQTKISGTSNNFPIEKFANYSNGGKTFLLRKTQGGYSLYEESAAAPDGLLLKGKVMVIDNLAKYMDTTGKVYDATFDASSNLTLKNETSTMIFQAEN